MPSNYRDVFDGLHSGLAFKTPCATISTAPITLSGEQTISGVALTEGDRVLVNAQSDARLNGIYTVSTGLWARAADADSNRDFITGTLVAVIGGTGRGIYELTTTGEIVIGTSSLSWSLSIIEFSYDDSYPSGSLQNALKRFVNVKSAPFNAQGDDATDDYAAIQAAIDYASANGGVVIIPQGIYRISQTLVVNTNEVTVTGDGSGWDQPSITAIRASARTRIKWTGSVGGTVFRFTSVAGDNPRVGGGLQDLMLDGQSSAATGLEIRSWRKGVFKRIYAYACTADGIFTGAFSGALAAQPYDCQFNLFESCRTDNRNLFSLTGNGVRLTGGQGNGATVGGNTSFNTFLNCEFGTNSPGYGLYMEDTDNNNFINCKIGGAGTLLGSDDQDSSGAGGHSRYNQFHGLESTVVCKASQTGGDSSQKNVFFGFARSNGKSLPTLETGGGGSSDANAIVFSTDEIAGSSPLKSTIRHRMEARLTVGNNSTQAGHAESASSSASLVLGNGSSNQMVLTNGTETWGININAANGNLRLIRSAGSGIIRLENNTTIVGQAGFNGTAPIAKPTITGSRGGNAALQALLTALASYGLITDSTTA